MSFITKEWLEAVLWEEIENFTVDSGCNPKDGYCGALFTVHVQFKSSKTKNKELPEFILIKTLSSNPGTQKWLCKNNIFYREFLVYSSLQMELLSFQKEAEGNKEIVKLVKLPLPDFINGAAVDFSKIPESEWENYATPQLNFILMPDLRKNGGFKMADRLEGVDYDHCSLIFKVLAKFHALSWAYKQRKGLQNLHEKFPLLKSTLFDSTSDELFESMFDKKYDVFKRIVSKVTHDQGELELGSELLKSLERSQKLSRDVATLYFSHVKTTSHPSVNKDNILRVPLPSPFEGTEEPCWNTVCHGDSWTNNFLFSYDDDGKVKEAIMLDFQLTFEGDPMSDLTYFMYSNTTYQVRQNHLSSLLNDYADTFKRVCDDLNVIPLPGFDHDELARRFHRAKVCGFFGANLNLALFLGTENSNEDDGEREKNNSLLEKMVMELVKELYQEGVI